MADQQQRLVSLQPTSTGVTNVSRPLSSEGPPRRRARIMPKTASRHPHSRTACDRCYKLKERCRRQDESSRCERCTRLDIQCATVRPVKAVGRRLGPVSRYGVPGGVAHQPSIGEFLRDHTDLQPDEKRLLLSLLAGSDGLDYHVASPGLQAQQQVTLATQLRDNLPLLKDAYLALAITMKQLRTGVKTDADTSLSLEHIARGMSILRAFSTLQIPDTAVCNTLGSVLSFSAYASVGVGVAEIFQHCLTLGEKSSRAPDLRAKDDPWHNYLSFMDTIDSLVHRRRPAGQICASAVEIDPHFGLCLPLLPYYHDLSVISNSKSAFASPSSTAVLNQQLENLHTAVQSWKPSSKQLETLSDRFTTPEVVTLLAQAKAYRLGALLMAHRLRYPFGEEDAQADIWSKELLMELDLAASVTKQSLRFVTLPFVIAAVEVQDQAERQTTLRCTELYVDKFAPAMQAVTRTFLSRVWEERDCNITTKWFDSVHKPCPVFESINETVFKGLQT